MRFRAVHQFHPACDHGDGVTNGMLLTQQLLRQLGYESQIYCEFIPEAMVDAVLPLAAFAPRADELLLVHHSLGYENAGWFEALTTPLALIYHNITPEQFWPPHDIHRRLSRLGREQLRHWSGHFMAAIGDSRLNCDELRAAGHARVVELPLLVDLDGLRAQPWDQRLCDALRDSFNLLFVGRIAPNKRQDLLLEVLDHLLRRLRVPVRLTLAGGVTSGQYQRELIERVGQLGLAAHVEMPGKVPQAQLAALYRSAHAFVCLSEHEGFGMPLIEAMAHGVPVVAAAHSGVPDTVGAGGLLMAKAEPARMAELVELLHAQPGLRQRLRMQQREHLARFERVNLLAQLRAFVEAVEQRQPPRLPAPARAPDEAGGWQVDGPCDSSYSLAVVNRGLALGLAHRGWAVKLHSTEGSGDYAPAPDLLRRYPRLAGLTLHGQPFDCAVNSRFCYPPRTDGMRGDVRMLHCYGWEETGFPSQYVDWFNRDLDLITVLSTPVAKALRDHGVRIPIVAVGAGIDEMLLDDGDAADDSAGVLPRLAPGTRVFLHISSGFPRKGIDALLEAWGLAFGADEPVLLVLKTFPNPHNQVHDWLKLARARHPDFAPVHVIDTDLDAAGLRALYRRASVFVLPSRGEGFGLPAAEAMAHGVPVIATGWGGHTDFCNSGNSWLCDWQFASARTHLDCGHSVWAEPRVDHLARLLREVTQVAPDDWRRRVEQARETARALTWDAVAARSAQAVAALRALPLWRDSPRVGWVSSWQTRCGIAEYSAFMLDHWPAGRVVVLANQIDAAPDAGSGTPDAGARPSAALEVLRCWRQDGQEDGQALLATIRRLGLGAVVIQYNFGFFPLSTLALLCHELKAAGVQLHIVFHSTQDLLREGRLISLRNIVPALRLATRLMVHGVGDLNRLLEFGLVDNATLWPHGVAAAAGAPAAAHPLQARWAGRTVLASTGFLLPHKGLPQLIAAFALARRDFPLSHLLLVNALYPVPESQQEAARCEALIREHGLEEHVTLITDFLDPAVIHQLLASASWTVLPYQNTQESSSAAVRMALGAGAAVAVTPLPIFGDVEDVVHRLPGCSVEQIAAGLAQLLRAPDIARDLRHKAAHWMHSRAWPLLARRMLDMIDGLALPDLNAAGPGQRVTDNGGR